MGPGQGAVHGRAEPEEEGKSPATATTPRGEKEKGAGVFGRRTNLILATDHPLSNSCLAAMSPQPARHSSPLQGQQGEQGEQQLQHLLSKGPDLDELMSDVAQSPSSATIPATARTEAHL